MSPGNPGDAVERASGDPVPAAQPQAGSAAAPQPAQEHQAAAPPPAAAAPATAPPAQQPAPPVPAAAPAAAVAAAPAAQPAAAKPVAEAAPAPAAAPSPANETAGDEASQPAAQLPVPPAAAATTAPAAAPALAAAGPAAVAAGAPAAAAGAPAAAAAAGAPAVPAAAADAPAAEQADFVQPTCPEEKHAQKPTWRRGYNYNQYSKTEYLLCTLTPSDCSTRRLRPPREWYDSLLGANFATFVVGAIAPDGAAVSFLLKAHAYEYVKAEYYIQGGETKRMFRTMGLQPGDGLKILVTGKASGVPTCRLEVIPAARNPHAAAIVAAAEAQAAKRAERLAANPKPPRGQAKKRKAGQQQAGDSDEEEGYEGGEGLGLASGRSSRQRARKHFGDDFVTGIDEAWAAAQHSDDDYMPEQDLKSEADPSGGRRRGGGGGGGGGSLASSHPPHPSVLEGLEGANPVVVATGDGGRNVLKIKVNRPPAGGSSGRQGSGGGSDAACPLQFLAGCADDVVTPHGGQASGAGATAPGQQQQQVQQVQQQQQAAASGTGAGRPVHRAAEPVALLSKKLLRDEAGAVTGASCRLGWEPGTRSVLQISRRLGEWGVSHSDIAAVEHYEARPAECALDLTLRLGPSAAGQVDQLEAAVLQLCEAL